jgi:hypothetical protein
MRSTLRAVAGRAADNAGLKDTEQRKKTSKISAPADEKEVDMSDCSESNEYSAYLESIQDLEPDEALEDFRPKVII